MTETRWLPSAAKNQDAAHRQFVELYGSLAVMNTYLKIALVCVCGVALALVALNVKTYQSFQHLKPLVIRINDLGRAEAVKYESLEYKPQEKEIKHFLMRFVQQHYGRMRSTIHENYPRSLYFLDSPLADALMDVNKKTKVIETFLVNQTEEFDIEVNQVVIEDLRQAPYKASVDFYRVYFAPSSHAEVRRERYVANFVFVIRENVPNAMIPVNPLGLTITYFREDQAFK